MSLLSTTGSGRRGGSAPIIGFGMIGGIPEAVVVISGNVTAVVVGVVSVAIVGIVSEIVVAIVVVVVVVVVASAKSCWSGFWHASDTEK